MNINEAISICESLVVINRGTPAGVALNAILQDRSEQVRTLQAVKHNESVWIQNYQDLMGQIRAMKARSDQYFNESLPGSDEAEKHLRVSSVLKELHRLGEAFTTR